MNLLYKNTMKTTKLNKQKCAGINIKSGKPCKVYQLSPDGIFCKYHTQIPELVAERVARASRAGKSQSYLPALRSGEIKNSPDLFIYIASLLTQIKKGHIKTTSHNLKDITTMGKLFMDLENRTQVIKRLDAIENKDKQVSH